MRGIFTAIALTAAALTAAAAPANDGAAERAAGGLVFVPNDAIDMVSEDLFISPTRFEMRRRGRRPARDLDILFLVAPAPAAAENGE